ncbi:hypothetical protein D3OALGA1CA_3554 [Olavius algarvensis associated proteobacterium Delta 3]|nr:hypothetical protein D3OALGA1CA_3554 [Olavius algarvensis associated proteobacterium Delta 3]
MDASHSRYISATAILDSDHPVIVEYARSATGSSRGPVETAVRLFYAVRTTSATIPMSHFIDRNTIDRAMY